MQQLHVNESRLPCMPMPCHLKNVAVLEAMCHMNSYRRTTVCTEVVLMQMMPAGSARRSKHVSGQNSTDSTP
jgi:hypothetical protein